MLSGMLLGELLAHTSDGGSSPNGADITAAVAAIIAVVVAAGGWISGSLRGAQQHKEVKQNLAITEGFGRYTVAVNHLHSGRPELALEGVGILRDLRTADWIDDAMRNRAAEALRNYTRFKSEAGGEPSDDQ